VVDSYGLEVLARHFRFIELTGKQVRASGFMPHLRQQAIERRLQGSGAVRRRGPADHRHQHEEAEVSIPEWLLVGPLLALTVSLTGAPPTAAEPLTPLSPAEIEYLGELRQVFSAYRDPTEFRSDGELLDLGRYVCRQRDDNGLVGYGATLVTPAVTQLALVHLCPA
jgi:hypothetical protein